MRIMSVQIITALILGAVECHAQRYSITGIGSLHADGQGMSEAFAINASDTIVGRAVSGSGAAHAFRLRSGAAMEDLGFINSPSFDSFALAINAGEIVTGAAITQSGGVAEAFRFVDGTGFSPLPWLPGGGDCYGRAINSFGRIVGWSNRGIGCGSPSLCLGNPGYAVRWDNSTIETMGDLGGYYSVATGINDAGEVCGYGAVPSNSATHAFRLLSSGGSAIDLGTLGGTTSQANAINNSGYIVGWAQPTGDSNVRAVIWSSGSAEDLGSLAGKTRAEALAISDAGEIVGFSSDLDGSNPRATLFRRGASPVDLNMLIDSASGWTLTHARGINSSGKIVGYGLSNGVTRAFLLRPAPECPTLSVRLAQSQVALCWSSQSNRLYQLQHRSDVTTNVWSDLVAAIQGNGTTNCHYDAILPGQPEKFYRIMCLTNEVVN